HLPCAAKKRPSVLKQALETTEEDVPDKEELLKTIEVSGKTEKPTTFPYAEHAPTGRASCMSCQEPIAKGDLRVAVEKNSPDGGFMQRGAGYLHPGCAVEHIEEDPDELFMKLKANSLNLNEADLETLESELESA